MAEVKFRRDTAFRKQVFVPDSFAHPAKMDAQLLIWLVSKYTKPGETILDPMGGMGTTMLACMFERNVILVELEEKFCLMMTGGHCDGHKCALCCERREWEAINSEEGFLLLADKYLTIYEAGEDEELPLLGGLTPSKESAPSDIQMRIAYERYGWRWLTDKLLLKYPQGEHDIVGNWELVKMKPQLGCQMGTCQIIQGDARNLEGLLADKIITSPPFAGQSGGKGEASRTPINVKYPGLFDRCIGGNKGALSDNPAQIDNLPYGDIDKIITSPPFVPDDQRRTRHIESDDADKKRGFKPMKGYRSYYSQNPDNIGNPKPYGNIDSIITSPPYDEGTGHGRGRSTELQETKGLHLHGAGSYSDTKDNIGELRGNSYLEAMFQVYRQCYKTLKPEGLMILVTKNFVRNKQIVRLDLDTIKLCEQAGFGLLERHWRKLPAQSFWRIIYHRKHPGVEQINWEDVLVFRR